MVSAPTAASPAGFAALRIRALARSSIGCISGLTTVLVDIASLLTHHIGNRIGSRSKRLTSENQRGILASEPERVRHHRRYAGVTRLVWNHVERNGGIRHVVIDCWRNPLMLKR